MRIAMTLMGMFVILLLLLVFVVMPGTSTNHVPMTAARTSVAPHVPASTIIEPEAVKKPKPVRARKATSQPVTKVPKNIDPTIARRKKCDRYLNNVALANSVSETTGMGSDTVYGMLLSDTVNLNAQRDADMEIDPSLIDRLKPDPNDEPFTSVVKRLQEIGYRRGWPLRFTLLLLKYEETVLVTLWNQLANGHGLIDDHQWLKQHHVGPSNIFLVDYDNLFWVTGSEAKTYFKDFCGQSVAMK